MAKTAMIKIKLVSSADTGFYYVTKKNSRTKTEKLVKKKNMTRSRRNTSNFANRRSSNRRMRATGPTNSGRREAPFIVSDHVSTFRCFNRCVDV